MKSYISCPVCGTKLGKAEEIRELDFQCSKCKENLSVNVNSNGVAVKKIEPAKKESMCSTVLTNQK